MALVLEYKYQISVTRVLKNQSVSVLPMDQNTPIAPLLTPTQLYMLETMIEDFINKAQPEKDVPITKLIVELDRDSQTA